MCDESVRQTPLIIDIFFSFFQKDEHSKLITGSECGHVFHRECILQWLLKHDECPICRKLMMTSTEMRQTAEVVLGSTRILELAGL